jgi:hypothetical protein
MGDTITRLQAIQSLCKELLHDVGVGARCYAAGNFHPNAIGQTDAIVLRERIDQALGAIQRATHTAQSGDLQMDLDRRKAEQDAEVARIAAIMGGEWREECPHDGCLGLARDCLDGRVEIGDLPDEDIYGDSVEVYARYGCDDYALVTFPSGTRVLCVYEWDGAPDGRSAWVVVHREDAVEEVSDA